MDANAKRTQKTTWIPVTIGIATGLLNMNFAEAARNPRTTACVKYYSELSLPNEIRLPSGRPSTRGIYPSDPKLLKDEYHRLVDLPVSELSAVQFLEKRKDMVELYSRLYPGFPKEEFDRWVANARISPYEFARMQSQKMTLGQVLEKEFKAFQDPEKLIEGRKNLQMGTNQALEEIDKVLGKFDPKNPKAYAAAMHDLPQKIREAYQGSCLGKNPIALKAMVRDMMVMFSAYGLMQAKKDDPTIQNFPWQYLSASVMYTTILSEVGCRNLLSTSHQIGDKIPDLSNAPLKVRMKQYFKDRGKGVMNYLPWSAYLNPIGLGITIAAERLQDKERPPEDYAVRLGYYIVYDTVVGVVRRVTILDPLFLRFFPWMQPALENLTKSGKLAFIARNTSELGARVLIKWMDATFFVGGDQRVQAILDRIHGKKVDTTPPRLDEKTLQELGDLNQSIPEKVPTPERRAANP